MKLIGYELGRVAALINEEEWRPRYLGVSEIIGLIQKRYQFIYPPKVSAPWEEVSKNGIKFGHGTFNYQNTIVPIQEVAFFNDGIVVSALTTQDSETWLADLFSWAATDLGIRDLTNVGRRTFLSRIVVEFDKPANNLVNKFDSYANILASLMQETYQNDFKMQLRTLGFHYDQLEMPEWIKVTYFSIDRRSNHKYEENRFHSESPFRTADHIKALESLEALLN